MTKQVKFTEVELDYYAEFLLDGKQVNFKRLTQVEYDALRDFVDFNEAPLLFNAEVLYEYLPDLCFDNDGEPTHYEEMLYDLMNAKENE
jgi:hypothetical protein